MTSLGGRKRVKAGASVLLANGKTRREETTFEVPSNASDKYIDAVAADELWVLLEYLGVETWWEIIHDDE